MEFLLSKLVDDLEYFGIAGNGVKLSKKTFDLLLLQLLQLCSR